MSCLGPQTPCRGALIWRLWRCSTVRFRVFEGFLLVDDSRRLSRKTRPTGAPSPGGHPRPEDGQIQPGFSSAAAGGSGSGLGGSPQQRLRAGWGWGDQASHWPVAAGPSQRRSSWRLLPGDQEDRCVQLRQRRLETDLRGRKRRRRRKEPGSQTPLGCKDSIPERIQVSDWLAAVAGDDTGLEP